MTISVMLYLETATDTRDTNILSIGACNNCPALPEWLHTFKSVVIEDGKSSLKDALYQFNAWLTTLGSKEEIHILGDWYSTDNTVLMDAYRACQITPQFGFIWQTLNDGNLIE